MKNFCHVVIMLLSIVLITGCNDSRSRRLYSSRTFSLYGNRVEQGKYISEAMSSDRLVSDYQSPANTNFNPLISYKFSINGRDNEAPAGQDHQALLEVPGTGVIVLRSVFGEKDATEPVNVKDAAAIPANTTVRFEADMRRVMKDFDENGFYTDFNGNKIFRSDFKGVWVAGATAPLSWDFENLPSRDDLRLTDPDGDGIFTCDMVFNVYDPSKHTSAERTISADLSGYPSLKSPFVIMDALYRMSLEEMITDIRPDSTFMAGKEWNGVWTRDISYSIILALAAIEPEIARNSLMYKVSNGRIIQDTGTGGSWPVSTDRQIWAAAAWEVYKTTGDNEWLKTAYGIISRSIDDDISVAFNPSTGLFYGESSFLDWRKQTYPLWMEPVDIYRSHNLGTNAVYYRTLTILDEMGRVLGIGNDYGKRAERLRESINNALWLDDRGYYGQYLYGHYNYSVSPRSEALGEALCILSGIAGAEKAGRMFTSVPVEEYGIPCIYPNIPGIPPYHNNAVWPFVQAYWTWAGASEGNTAVVEHGMASVYRQAALFLTNKENMVAATGDFNGTEVNSDRQLWSVAANLAMTYRIIFGLDYQSDNLTFRPFIPEDYKGHFELTGLRYRNCTLDITIDGYGNGIADFILDGNRLADAIVSSSLTGHHTVSIRMNSQQDDGVLVMRENAFSPQTPEASAEEGTLRWKKAEGAAGYTVYRNGKRVAVTADTSFVLSAYGPGEYQVLSVSSDELESFLSRPVQYMIHDKSIVAEAESFAKPSAEELSGFSGSGFVRLDRGSRPFVFTISVPGAGDYVIEFRYSNGSGPVNTDNKCAQRSLWCNGLYAGTAVFPQRGREEWSDWGLSNPVTVSLKRGVNRLELTLESYNNNMNGEINTFMLDFIRYFPAEVTAKSR